MTIRRPVSGAVRLACGLLLLAACSSSGSESGSGTERSLQKASGLPPAAAVARNGTAVAVGRWGVVAARDSQDKPVTFAIKAIAVRHGKAGELEDVQLLNNDGTTDPAKAVPYYISYDYAVLAGGVLESPVQELSAASRATGDSDPTLTTLLVPDEFERCEPRGDDNAVPPGLGYDRHGCIVALAARSGVVPKYLRYDKLTGSERVRFPIPAR